MSVRSTSSVPAQPARRSLLKRLSGALAGSFLAGPLQALLGRTTPVAAGTLTGGSNVFLAEIITVPFNFAPKGYARCDGQLLPISQNTALFSLLGTFYGGDGKSTFALPNLNGCVAIGAGRGPGLSEYYLGQTSGSATTVLTGGEMPSHTHSLDLTFSTEPGTLGSPENAYLARNGSGRAQYHTRAAGSMASVDTGAAAPHNNLQPYLTLTYCIALQGVYPPRQ